MPRRDDVRYKVVVNHEEQYRLLAKDRAFPEGFRDAGKEGTLDELRASLREILANLRHERREQNIEELLDEEDRSTSTASEHLPR